MTTKIKFDERGKNQAIEYCGGVNEVCEGCLVDLEQDGLRFTVKVAGSTGQHWTGQITGFADVDEDENTGTLKIGTTIEFEDRHVFRCAA